MHRGAGPSTISFVDNELLHEAVFQVKVFLAFPLFFDVSKPARATGGSFVPFDLANRRGVR